MKTALITGITGQDGYYLAHFLIRKGGYKVIGLVKSVEALNSAVGDLYKQVDLAVWDMQGQQGFDEVLQKHKPCEVYNLAALSSGEGMYEDPLRILEINGRAVVRILEAIRKIDPTIRFCQASSREVFGVDSPAPQNENTKYNPRSPYGVAKAQADFMVNIYRERYSIFACSAILYNHESPRRSMNFVTKKIVNGALQIKYKNKEQLVLGSISDRRDWGFAGDYVEAMWLMLQSPIAKNYVISSGQAHTVAEFCDKVFSSLGLNYKNFVVQANSLAREPESQLLIGDSSLIRNELGWKPRLDLDQLIALMIEEEELLM